MRTRLAIGVLLAVVAAIGLRTSLTAAAGVPTISGYPAETTIANGVEIEAPTAAQVGDSANLNSDKAFDLAVSAAGALIDPLQPHSIQLVQLTNDRYGPMDSAGVVQKLVDHELVWLVRFTGKPQPVYGGLKNIGIPMDPGPAATELNVALDAKTGALVQMFSFQ
jgi:hypothetical protein